MVCLKPEYRGLGTPTSLTDLQITERLVLSTRTVQAHLRSIYSQLGVPNRGGAIRYAVEHGLV